ncbi:histidinol dehydrogenase [Thomasclavelia sp.]|uniref:histidinol dehydrogenase n=1 Tax=Thomasclavelia sp. TaxID=3025757 RepID=UPI0025D5E58E|nr:histidinol dehydrogenase [Thomasclavelia sp.]
MLKVIDYDGNLEAIATKLDNRKENVSREVNEAVLKIIDDINTRGNEALFEYCYQFDGYQIKDENDLIVSEAEKEAALKEVDPDYLRILNRAKKQIIEFHQNQIDKSWSMFKENGVIMGQMVRPIKRVALYVPGGTASYPSTVLMNAIPAKLAGVKDLVIITPVKADGKVNPIIIAAAKVCGIDTIYKFGGAQGVAAMAHGTETIAKADKIVGPGNIYVATAKKLSYGLVDIDMVAGPSEVLVIADKNANSKYIAADLISQAEHDKLASAMLVTTSKELVVKVNEELKRQVAYLSRKEIIETSLINYGGAIVVNDLDEAFAVSNYLAPEHLEVLVDNPVNYLPKIENAGSIFLGEYSPEPLGDYMSGTNHVLPTGGTAKFYSALGVYDFVKYSSYSYYPKKVLKEFKDDVMTFAKSEGLDGHANSIAVRFEEEEDEN